MQNKQTNCVCPKVKCQRHGDCAACAQHHLTTDSLPFCQRK